jgi:endonuclease/exonuclease/phosphatase family metal-dependent hydrolase
MKFFLIPLTIFLIMWMHGLQLSASEPFRIRVLCYNIHHGAGIDRKLDLERIAKVIQSVSPDIVALQEVDKRTQRVNQMDQPAELARLTGMEVRFERNISFQGGEYGNAILSKFPISSHRNVHLPNLSNGEQRGVLICELKPKDFCHPLLFLCTHLDHRSDEDRQAGANVINQIISKPSHLPAILAGDLNAIPQSEVLQIFQQQWTLANCQELPTVPVTEPTKQIDFILYRPAQQWKTIEVRVLDEAIASDHRAIFAELEWQGSNP